MKPPSQEAALFEAAVLLPDDTQRAAFLDVECAGNPSLRQRLESLLAAHTEQESPEGTGLPTFQLPFEEKPQEHAGMMVGRYKLLEKLGTGGFGEVWAAEQKEPVRRRVALKVIKLGMDTQQVVARFQAERQALAMMDHPNIARVLDAGATDSGRLYFVMELVKGIPITTYCDQAKLDTKARLDLFMQVCHAIQHAHQKGIIHRDIKPSNIMVTLHDGVPVPKVIDFGIAKATQQELTDQTIYTQYAQFIGTPAYMSPEQAEMSGLDIDTRSDIYSLGVLLYELLTGAPPFDNRTLMQSGLDAMRKIIREKEPARPSTRLRETQATPANSTGPTSRLPPLALDLDWIVMKCLEKDRQRRYETANGLATDIRRHLTDEPVNARPPSTAYRVQKALRRNKLAFTTAMAVLASLALGIAFSSWQAIRANHEAQRAVAAENEARERLQESEAISTFLSQVFMSPDPARDGRTITVAETLDSAARRLESDLAAQPALRARLLSALASTYHSLGLYKEATELNAKILDYHKATSGPEHFETLAAMNNLANGYATSGRHNEALKLQAEVLALDRKVLGPEDPVTITAMSNLAISYGSLGRHQEALTLKEQVLALRIKVLGPEHHDTLAARSNLAASYADTGQPEPALKLREEVMESFRATLGRQHPSTLRAMQNLALSYYDVGRYDEALRLREEQLALSREVLGPEHPETLASMSYLGYSYLSTNRGLEALQLRENLLALSEKLQGPKGKSTVAAMSSLADSYAAVGRIEEALELYEKALALDLEINGLGEPNTLATMSNLAALYLRSGRPDKALPLLEEVQPHMLKVNGPNHAATIAARSQLIGAYSSSNRFEEALQQGRELLAHCRKVLGPEHPNTLSVMVDLAVAYRKAGQAEQALEVLGTNGLALHKKVFGHTHAFTLNAMTELAITLQAANRVDEAIALEETALRLKRAHLPTEQQSLGAQMTRESMENLATCYEKAGRDIEARTLREDLEMLALDDPATTSTP